MKIAIVGSRDFPRLEWVRGFVDQILHEALRAYGKLPATLDELPAVTRNLVILSGGARGVDSTAVERARMHKIFVEEIPAEWDRLGKGAGMIRNTEIVARADEVYAFWDGESRGTWDTIKKARAAGKLRHIYCWPKDPVLAPRHPPAPGLMKQVMETIDGDVYERVSDRDPWVRKG